MSNSDIAGVPVAWEVRNSEISYRGMFAAKKEADAMADQLDEEGYSQSTVRALYTAPEWQPIETAPKDGTQVLGYGEAAGEIHGPSGICGIEVMNYCGTTGDFAGFDWGIAGDAYANWFRPTHWMPLPLPPAPNQGEAS